METGYRFRARSTASTSHPDIRSMSGTSSDRSSFWREGMPTSHIPRFAQDGKDTAEERVWQIINTPQITHGHVIPVRPVSPFGLFDLEEEFEVVVYNSLTVDPARKSFYTA